MFPRTGRILLLIVIVVFIARIALHAQPQHDHSAMTSANAKTQQGTPAQQQELNTATEAMSGHDHDHHMGAHMHMSTLRPATAADTTKAQQIVESARASLEKYRDVKAAEADGFKIFHGEVKQPMYHFTNFRYAMEAGWSFNPEHPTSLLYEKSGDTYKLIGAMYTAPARFSEDELDKRVPLSVAQWHQHVNLCRPPSGQNALMLQPHAEFGLNGSISTKEACEAAGGTFIPRIFGWMVHLYPYEKTMDAIWSVERQKHGDDMADMPGMKH